MPACASTYTHTGILGNDPVHGHASVYIYICVCEYVYVCLCTVRHVVQAVQCGRCWSSSIHADQRYVVSVESMPVKGSRRAGGEKRDACVHMNWSVQ